VYKPLRRHRQRGPREEARPRGTALVAEAAEENTRMAMEGEEDTKALAGEEAEAAAAASTTEGTSGVFHLANGDEVRHLLRGNPAKAGAEDAKLEADADAEEGDGRVNSGPP
jgi:hypothetical protein